MCPSPNCHLSGVKDVVQEALTGTVANGKLPVAQDLREHRILIGGPHKRGWLEPNVRVSDELDVLGVQHVHTASARVGALVGTSGAVVIKHDRGALEHKVLEARVCHVGVGVTDVAGKQRLVRLVTLLAGHDDGRLIVTHRNGVVQRTHSRKRQVAAVSRVVRDG